MTRKYSNVSLAALAGSLIAGLFVATVFAGPFEDAATAYDRGDYATAMRLFRPMAENTDAVAQYYLGDLYEKGRGMPQDYGEAIVGIFWSPPSIRITEPATPSR